MKKLVLSLLCMSYFILQGQNFTLKSEKIKGQAVENFIYNGMGCDGDNMSPLLEWEDAPLNTKSFAITLYDPDAPTESGWWHWIVFDIPSTVKMLDSDAGNIHKKLMPLSAVQSKTDFGTYGYGGPCPPAGSYPHQYIITVYALDVDKLGLDKDSSAAMVGFYLKQHTIQKASLIFYMAR